VPTKNPDVMLDNQPKRTTNKQDNLPSPLTMYPSICVLYV
jgi:hypothetical protein